MAETFRTTKLEKFIQKKVDYMEMQQKIINSMKQLHGDAVVRDLEINNLALYNYTFDLCREFGIEMPHVLGVTPNV